LFLSTDTHFNASALLDFWTFLELHFKKLHATHCAKLSALLHPFNGIFPGQSGLTSTRKVNHSGF